MQSEKPVGPSKSWRQARMMARAAAEPEYAVKRNVPMDVAGEFHKADLAEKKYFDDFGQLRPEDEMA